MISKILLPTDFSEVAEKAIDFTINLKGCGAKNVVLLHVLDSMHISHLEHYTSQYTEFAPIMKRLEDDTARALESTADKLEKEGFQVKTRVERGTPFNEILRVEKEEGVSLIVIGSHGKSNIAEMLLGSVSEKVVRKAKNPVVLVKR